jgi:hypothetical protein
MQAASGLLKSVSAGDLPTVKRLLTDGTASITESDARGRTALLLATLGGYMEMVQWLLTEGGASVQEAGEYGYTSLLWAAFCGRIPLMTWLLTEGGASITEVGQDGRSVWRHLRHHIQRANRTELSSLLRVMVLLDDAPPEFVSLLKLADARIVAQGQHFRDLLPSYLEQQPRLVVIHCPLPAVLKPIVAEYAAFTQEDIWTDWVRWAHTADSFMKALI